MVKTVRAKWSEITGNRKEIDETIIGKGIEEQSLVNSDELNSIVYRQDEMLDDLQRANAWNIGKEYNQGDMIFVNVNYKRLSDAIGKTYKCFVICKQDKVTAEPFINKDRKAIAFSKNYDYAVTQFIIQVDNDSTALTHFINSDFWDFVNVNDDLSNATKLSVSNEAKLGSQGKDSSIITFDRDIILNGNLDTKGTFDIKGNLTGGSLHSNNNIALGEAFARTPAFTARGDEIVNAEWCKVQTDYIEFSTDDKFNPIYEASSLQGLWDDLNISKIGDYKEARPLYTATPVCNYVYMVKKIPVDFDIELFNSIASLFWSIHKVNIKYEFNYGGGIGSTTQFIDHIYHSASGIIARVNQSEYDNLKNNVNVTQDNIEANRDKIINKEAYISVDFSKDFTIYVYDLFANKNPYIISNILYMYHFNYTTQKYEYQNIILTNGVVNKKLIYPDYSFVTPRIQARYAVTGGGTVQPSVMYNCNMWNEKPYQISCSFAFKWIKKDRTLIFVFPSQKNYIGLGVFVKKISEIYYKKKMYLRLRRA